MAFSLLWSFSKAVFFIRVFWLFSPSLVKVYEIFSLQSYYLELTPILWYANERNDIF